MKRNLSDALWALPVGQLRRVLACAWPALLLAAACLVPFLGKAYLIDDPWFLAMARQIVQHPLHPTDFTVCWNTLPNCVQVYQGLMPGNTLMGYALVPTVLLGAPEWMGHLTQLVFAWVAILAMAALMLRLGYSRGQATLGALLLVAIPPFLPMASGVMPDVLAAALAFVGIERLTAWKADRKWHQGAVAGVALGLAGMARPHLMLLLPLAAFLLFDTVEPRAAFRQLQHRFRLWTPVLLGGAVLLMTLLATREPAVAHPAAWRGLQHLLRNLRALPLFFCFPLPLAAYWIAAQWTIGRRRLMLVIVMACCASVAAGDARIFLSFIGASVLAALLWDAYRKRDHMGVFLALWMLLPLPIVYYGHLPIKYLLPCMPAVILTCFRLSAAVPVRITCAVGVALVIGGVAYSLLILRSDAEFAEFGRSSMLALVKPHAAAGEKVWVGGHFSAYWYGQLAGAEVVGNDRGPQPGDLLVVGLFEDGATHALARFPKRILAQAITHTYSFGRTAGVGAGLYTNAAGSTWLWGFGVSDQDRYELWRIE